MTDERTSKQFQESSAGRVPAGLPAHIQNPHVNSNRRSTDRPGVPVGILPVYSTLAPNVGHFSFGQEATSAANQATNFVCFTYTVPKGRVIQADSFRVNVVDTFDAGGVSTGVPLNLLTLALFVNDVSEPYNQDIKAEPFDGDYPCTIVAAPLSIITIRVTYDYSAVAAAIASVLFKADLYGDMLFQNDAQTENTGLRLPTLIVRSDR